MKTKEQQLLEEAYSKVAAKYSVFKDSKGTPITTGDHVLYGNKKNGFTQYKIVGGQSVLGTTIPEDKLQIEQIEDLKPGQIPKLLYVKPSQVTKVSVKTTDNS